MKRLFLGLVIALTAVGCTRVSPGHVGISVVSGGSDRGVQDFPATTGWVFYNPITTTILEYPTFVQTAILTANPHEGNNPNSPQGVDESITFTNKDKMTINADISLSYHLEAAKVPQFYVKFRSDDLNNFTYGFLRNVVRDKFNEHGGRYTIDQIMGDNAAFLQDVRTSVQQEVGTFGVELDQFGFVGSPRPPQAVIDQINASVHAAQLTTQKQNELAQVQADMAKEREKTDTYARNGVAMAEATAKANKMVADSITPSLLEMKRLERWDGKLPYVNGGSTNPFISLQKQ